MNWYTFGKIKGKLCLTLTFTEMQILFRLPLAFFVLLLAANTAFATPTKKVLNYHVFVNATEKSFRLALENESEEAVQVKVFNKNGEEILAEEHKPARKLNRKYHLANFSENEYTLQIERGGLKVEYPLTFEKVASFQAFASTSLQKGKFQCAWHHAKAPITIRLTDQNTGLVFSHIQKEAQFAALFNTETLAPGSYALEVFEGEKLVLSRTYEVK